MKWIAQINGAPDEGMNVQDTAVAAVQEVLELHGIDMTEDQGPPQELWLEVYRCEQHPLPAVGHLAPTWLIEYWSDNGPEGSDDLHYTSAQRADLAQRIDALIDEWASENGGHPNWFTTVGAPALRVQIEWYIDEYGCDMARVPDAVWAQVEALDAQPDEVTP